MTGRAPRHAGLASRPLLRVAAVLCLASLCVGWSAETIRYVAWSSVEFFPDDLRRQVRRNYRRFDAGIERGLEAPPSWRAASPGSLGQALEAQATRCAESLREPVPLDDLVEELGVLAVRVLDASDPLAVAHDDPQEPRYAGAYQAYVDSVRDRVRLVYYGQDAELINGRDLSGVRRCGARAEPRTLPYVGEEFFRTGSLRDWRVVRRSLGGVRSRGDLAVPRAHRSGQPRLLRLDGPAAA